MTGGNRSIPKAFRPTAPWPRPRDPAPGLLAQTSSADYTEPYQLRALEIYRDIIAMRTSAGHGQVPAMADYLANVFREGGFPAEHVHVFPHVSEAGEEIAALVVQYPGDGLSGEGTILLTGHMDVVDALPEDWERDPFTLIEEGPPAFRPTGSWGSSSSRRTSSRTG